LTADVLDARFELQAPLGSGGMAAVYLAWDRQGERSCAVKVLADVLARDEEFRRRFRHEAASAGALTHPRIVTVYGWGQDGLRQFIAMEYVGGGSLRERLQREGRLAEGDAVRIAAEVADALAYAHGRHVVHRDIKPHNILLTEDGHVKVADFGIARTLGATSLTRTGTVMGSAPYLSPEQARGEGAGPASDQYALGIVLYEMLAGRPPFGGEEPVAVALKHLHEPVPDVRAARPDVSAGTAAVVARLLTKDPAARYPDAGAAAGELHRLAASLPQPPAASRDGVARPVPPVPSSDDATRQLDVTAAIGSAVQHGANGLGATRVLPAEGPSDTGRAPLPTAAGVPARAAAHDTAQLHLPGSRRYAVAARVAVAAVSVAFGVIVLGAAYRAAWTAAHVAVPNLVGRTVAYAGQTAQVLRLGVLVAGERQDPNAAVGVVLTQDPPPGTEAAKGTIINLTVSQGSGIVPDLTGVTVTQATGMLERVGLRLGRVSYSPDDRVEAGRVIYQFQAAGARLDPNGGVDVLVSQGAPVIPLPPPSPEPSGPPGPPPQEPHGRAVPHRHGHDRPD
jgi:eukaryotic-like serine/threonine-protein kinase